MKKYSFWEYVNDEFRSLDKEPLGVYDDPILPKQEGFFGGTFWKFLALLFFLPFIFGMLLLNYFFFEKPRKPKRYK